MRKALCVLVAVVLFSSAVVLVSGQGSHWTQMAPPSAPSVRSGHDMAYDNESDRVILFGGETTPGSRILNNETWAYDLNSNTWVDRNPSPRPSARFAHAMAYDADSDEVILYGGEPGSGETWGYDYNTNTWTNMSPSTSPPVGMFVETAYDRESDRVILFGGVPDSNETWAYDFNANTWTKENPSVSPSARGGQGMAYDAKSDRTVLFGGRNAAQDFGDTWAYDLNSHTWRQMNPATAPSPRHGAAMAYDAGSDRAILFGGTTVTGDITGGDETWVYDLNNDTWALEEKGTGPSARYGAVMAHDSESNRIVLFGGTGEGTWTGSGWGVRSAPTDSVLLLLAVAIAAGVGVALAGYWVLRSRSRKREGKNEP